MRNSLKAWSLLPKESNNHLVREVTNRFGRSLKKLDSAKKNRKVKKDGN